LRPQVPLDELLDDLEAMGLEDEEDEEDEVGPGAAGAYGGSGDEDMMDT
jgi:hypothetical protein